MPAKGGGSPSALARADAVTEPPRRTSDKGGPSSPSDTDDEPPLFQVGEVVGGVFEIRGMLGEGGMAQVWEAKDHDLERRVAIKAALPKPNVPPLRKEAQALAAFRHPSLVTVHGVGHHHGIDYIVMERIYGISLAMHLEQRRHAEVELDVAEVIALLVDIADGLAVVHRTGLAHRDVKPQNIMLTPDGRVVLMDFGLVLPEYEVEQQRVIAGSPPYMAPETLRNTVVSGGGQLVDVYALGATAFELLTLQTPFCDANTMEDLFRQHDEGRIPSVMALRPEVPLALDALIQEMLAKDPNERPQSVEGVAWQLRSIEDRVRRKKTPRTLWPKAVAAPARLAAASKTKSKPPEKQRGRPSGGEACAVDVLIVEDDDALARVEAFYVKEVFGADAVTLRRAHDGVEAIRMVRDRAPHLLLLDLHLPKMNGIEVGMHIRGERLAPDMKVIAVSAGAQEHDLQVLHQLGVHHFVPKGAEMNRLAVAVRPLFPDHFSDR